MPRDLPIGNGNLLVAFDKDSLLRELYFPHVGEESHTKGNIFRFGVWVNGQFSWVPDGWKIRKNYLKDSLVTDVELIQEQWQLKIVVHEAVDFHENAYVKKIILENLSDGVKDVRLFFSHNFCISGNDVGDTAVYRPENRSLLHYKGDRYFLINVFANDSYGIPHFATGNKDHGSFEGTWKDAEDGTLSRNPIAQGSVDSVAGIHVKVAGNSKEVVFYWICAGTNWEQVKNLNETIRKKTPEEMLNRTHDYWHLWANKDPINQALLPPKLYDLYKRSLLICRTQINNCGSIIAGNDSDVIQFNRDTYSYMWPRDGALVAYALDLAGYNITANFFSFCAKIIEKDGYFLHKYTPSGSLASSWHPWIKGNTPQLPIQEDETALVIWSLWHHYRKTLDIEFIKPFYKPLIKRAADFMMNYRDEKTSLPLPSYDLWEEERGVTTFTTAAVIGGLLAAANFTEMFGEKELTEEYREGAEKMRQGMNRHLFLEKEDRFAKSLQFHTDGSIRVDTTVDASLYGTFAFGAYAADDEKVMSTMKQVIQKLMNTQQGVCRYENDSYYRSSKDSPSNPWFITTLWIAQYYIAIAKNKEQLDKALPILEWVSDHALPSGVLAEQVNPETGEPLSVSPLTWSHGTFIATVQEYLNKLGSLDRCPSCGHSKYGIQ